VPYSTVIANSASRIMGTIIIAATHARKPPVSAWQLANKDRPGAVRYTRHALSWQGFGSSRAAGGAALAISDVESGDLFVVGPVISPSSGPRRASNLRA
jgi:hypothetical protein